ncbi:MAG: hypothetical protein KJ792_15600, partial [Actinobacteria bacterium]|nr:hypothetical protein [Actinomycetota bacterium]
MNSSRGQDSTVARHWFGDRGVRTKVLTAVGVLALVSLLAIAWAVRALLVASSDIRDLASLQAGWTTDVSLVHQEELKARMLIAEAAAAGSKQAAQGWVDQIAGTDADLQTAADRISAQDLAAHNEWADFLTDWQAWRSVRDSELVPAALANDQGLYQQRRAADGQPLIDKLVADL